MLYSKSILQAIGCSVHFFMWNTETLQNMMSLSPGHVRQISKKVTVIFILFRFCLSQKSDRVPANAIAVDGAFITIPGYASKGPKLERHTCRSMLQCSHLCLKNSKCASYNYQVSTARNSLCELSEDGIVSTEERDARLKKIPGFVFVQTVRKDLVSQFCFDFTQVINTQS